MSRKWLEKEGKAWVEEGLIEEEQLRGIMAKYPKQEYQKTLLPLLASILIGLSLLTFIAANWDDIPQLLRVVVICAAVIGFYIGGDYFRNKGKDRLGAGLVGIGIFAFGAGIFLTGQMFHFVSYNAMPFIFWTIGAFLMAVLVKSRFIHLLTLIILMVGQFYTVMSFQSFSYVLALLLVFGMGHLTYHRPDEWTSALFGISFFLTALLFFVTGDVTFVWMYAIIFAVYVVGQFVGKKEIGVPFRIVSLLAAIALNLFFVFTLDSLWKYAGLSFPNPFLYLAILVLLGALLFIAKGFTLWLDVLLFLPVFYLEGWGDVLYLAMLFVYSVGTLLKGYHQGDKELVNMGTVLFLISTVSAYIHLAWDFMPKSLFFLFGGVVLFALSWYLELRRRKVVDKSGGGEDE